MYFLRRQAPIHLTSERAVGLWTSINSPVIATPELPPGPARAAILVHRELEGRMAVSVGVGSLKTADCAIWTCDADLDESTSVEVAVDAALSFGEGMGFLFEDEDVGPGNPAHTGWNELLGGAPATEEPVRAPSGAAALGPSDDGEILELTELAEAEPAPLEWNDGEDEAGDGFAAGPGFDLDQATFDAPEPQVPLSKFRGRLPGEGDAAKGGRAALGKLKLVKRRREAGAELPSWLQRVLSSF